MRHHLYNPDFNFVRPPEDFNKYTDRELLQYCLGATMYMPGTKDFTPKILSGAMPGLTTVVLCFEDACPEESVEAAEQNVYRLLDTVAFATEEGTLSPDNIPLIFVRTRNPEQFRHFAAGLNKRRSKALCGINFPKFSAENGEEYFAYGKLTGGFLRREMQSPQVQRMQNAMLLQPVYPQTQPSQQFQPPQGRQFRNPAAPASTKQKRDPPA